MIFGAIVAGGVGIRMNISDLPKQFMMLGNKPIIIHTLEKFILCNKLDYIYLGVHKDWIYYVNDLLDKYQIDKTKIFVEEGGDLRNITILNIINKINENHGEDNNHIIVTHDAVRPFVTVRMINENIEAAIKYKACDTVISSVDTIISSEDGQFISHVPERSKMYLGQTPQSFNINLFKKLYNNLNDLEKNIITDACSVFVLNNKPVSLVLGDVSNIKITTANDYKIANAMIMEGKLID